MALNYLRERLPPYSYLCFDCSGSRGRQGRNRLHSWKGGISADVGSLSGSGEGQVRAPFLRVGGEKSLTGGVCDCP